MHKIGGFIKNTIRQNREGFFAVFNINLLNKHLLQYINISNFFSNIEKILKNEKNFSKIVAI